MLCWPFITSLCSTVNISLPSLRPGLLSTSSSNCVVIVLVVTVATHRHFLSLKCPTSWQREFMGTTLRGSDAANNFCTATSMSLDADNVIQGQYFASIIVTIHLHFTPLQSPPAFHRHLPPRYC